MDRSKTVFATASPWRLFFITAIPGMISMVAASVYSLVEGIFIGQFIQGQAFAAQNLAMPLIMINFSLADLIGVGSSVQISISLGRQDEKRACSLFSASVMLIFLCALVMGTVMYTAAPSLLDLMGKGAAEETKALAVKYLRTYAIFSPLCTVVFAMDNYLRICGYVKSSMALNIFMSALTIGLLFLFVLVFQVGIVGAALASSIAMAFCALIAFAPFIAKKTVLRFSKPHISLHDIKAIVYCGSPAFLNNIAGRLASIVMNLALLRVGGDIAASTYGVLMYSGDFAMLAMYGMADALQPAIGYNWGAGNKKRVRAIVRCVYTACGAVSLLMAAILFVFSRQVTSIFVDTAAQPALWEMSSSALKLFSSSVLLRWFGFCTQSYLSATEHPLPAALISVTSACVFPLLSIALLWGMGLEGLWLNTTMTFVLTDLLALAILVKKRKDMQ